MADQALISSLILLGSWSSQPIQKHPQIPTQSAQLANKSVPRHSHKSVCDPSQRNGCCPFEKLFGCPFDPPIAKSLILSWSSLWSTFPTRPLPFPLARVQKFVRNLLTRPRFVLMKSKSSRGEYTGFLDISYKCFSSIGEACNCNIAGLVRGLWHKTLGLRYKHNGRNIFPH
jgi:hypothetical protein